MTDRARGWALVSAQFALLAVLVLAPTGTAWALPAPVEALGTAGRVVGGAAILIGAAQLGLAASVHPAPTDTATLRTDGAYRFVRHPIYTGVLVLGAAIALTGCSLLHLAAWAALLGVLVVKARFEERLLVARFPGYPDYARRTGRFLPRRFPRGG
jgi:protein-S-isoprenylcysteine O-methyltransferase Ste14